MKNQGSGILVLSPELWAGAATPFDKPFNEAFKTMVSVQAYDAQSRTRWFPISYLMHVKQLIREHKLTTDGHLDNAHAQIQAELDRRRAVKVATNADGQVTGPLADAYAILGLHPSASATLVYWAILLARKDGNTLGTPSTELLRKEEAYRQICGAVGVVPA